LIPEGNENRPNPASREKDTNRIHIHFFLRMRPDTFFSMFYSLKKAGLGVRWRPLALSICETQNPRGEIGSCHYFICSLFHSETVPQLSAKSKIDLRLQPRLPISNQPDELDAQ
jgi:hypothetical protein